MNRAARRQLDINLHRLLVEDKEGQRLIQVQPAMPFRFAMAAWPCASAAQLEALTRLAAEDRSQDLLSISLLAFPTRARNSMGVNGGFLR